MKVAIVAIILALGVGYAYHVYTGWQISEHEQLRLEAEKEAERLEEIYEQEREKWLADYERYRDRTAELNRDLEDARQKEGELVAQLREASEATDQAESDLSASIEDPVPESAEQLASDTVDMWDELYGGHHEITPLPEGYMLDRLDSAYLATRELIASRELLSKLRVENASLDELTGNYAEQVAMLEERVRIDTEAIDQCASDVEACHAYTEALEKQLGHTEDQLEALENQSWWQKWRPKIQYGVGGCGTIDGFQLPCGYVGVGWSF